MMQRSGIGVMSTDGFQDRFLGINYTKPNQQRKARFASITADQR